MNSYKPRRSSKHWLENAPEYILAVYDNGGKTCDRFTVLIGGSLRDEKLNYNRNVEYLSLSENPSHSHGFSQFGEMPSNNRAACGKKISWNNLPDNVRNHVTSRLNELKWCVNN